MLISYTHKFIFVHIYKTGGTSIKTALRPFAHSPRRLTATLLKKWPRNLGSAPEILERWGRLFPARISALEVKRRLPSSTFNDFHKFAVVRNPWDLQVSLYHYMMQTPGHFQHDEVKRLSGFDEYIEWRAEKGQPNQYDFLRSSKGDILVDFVGRYESLADDFEKICDNLGVRATLPHRNISNRARDYRSYYCENSRSIVEELFAADIREFGYTFSE